MLAGLGAVALVTAHGPRAEPAASRTPDLVAGGFVADGRQPLGTLLANFDEFATRHGWVAETVFAYDDAPGESIRAWRTVAEGEALWIVAGIHGEEPAGPNAIAAHAEAVAAFARTARVPVVVLPLCNPRAYARNWRYPNTAERDWRAGGGYSVGDAEHLLPHLEQPDRPRAPRAPGPETQALTQYVLRLAERYPPRLVLDLHEDELSAEGGYLYSQGVQADDNPVAAEIVRQLQASGLALRRDGQTRFGEPIVDGVISRDDRGGPIRDGSIDELFAATDVFVGGRRARGPAAGTVIVVETPAFAGARLEQRVAAHGAVVRGLERLWSLAPPRR